MNARHCLVVGIVFALLAVTLGAFGAHWLEGAIQRWNLSLEDQTRRLHNWEVGVRYQMYNALALIAIGILATRHPNRWFAAAGIAFLMGTLIFSGCLYAYVLSGQKIFGMLVVFGGLAQLAGWTMMLIGVVKSPKTAD